jgi:hypothetical protein
MIRWMIQFSEDDLAKLTDLQRRFRINGREWMRALPGALAQYHELPGSVTLPVAVVVRGDSERVGLSPSPEPRTQYNLR